MLFASKIKTLPPTEAWDAHQRQRTARLLSAHTTCRLQHRSLHTYLIDALTAHAHGNPVPLLA